MRQRRCKSLTTAPAVCLYFMLFGCCSRGKHSEVLQSRSLKREVLLYFATIVERLWCNDAAWLSGPSVEDWLRDDVLG